MLQKYFTITTSPARTVRPMPSTVIVFVIPSGSVEPVCVCCCGDDDGVAAADEKSIVLRPS